MPPLWTIVLAAGAGRRLASLTGGVPKQFWSGAGGRSLLEETLTRLGPLSETSHRVVITDQAHRPMLQPLAASFGTAVFQPRDRGTAAGVLLSLAPVLASDPDSIVVVTPCDHGVVDHERFLNGIALAAEVVAADDRVVLFGVEATASCDDYGWIVPASQCAASGVRPVASFVEKPPRQLARRLLERGAAWNTMVIVARASGLRDLCVSLLPELAPLAEATALPPVERARALADIYGQLTTHDFSRDVLARATDLLCYVWPKAIGWSDLGTPERLLRWLNRTPSVASLRVVA